MRQDNIEWEDFTHHGRAMEWTIVPDDDAEAPWDREDFHGPVSKWASRHKRPAERILCEDHGSARFYDWEIATMIAKRDGWGLTDEAIAELSAKLGRPAKRGDIASEAVRLDFERLRGWCADQWWYVGVKVRDATSGEQVSVWSIESDCRDYILEVRDELASELHPLAEREEAANLEMTSD